MPILTDHQYSLDDFNRFSNMWDIYPPPEDIIQKINNLAKLVGAPTYKKTPVFKQHYNRNGRKRRGDSTRMMITADDWEAMRNFKPTVLAKPKDGIDVEIESVRCQLNKLTASNYSKIYETIILILSRVLEMNVEKRALEKVGISIFEIGSINKFWSKLYADLYKDLIDKFPIMRIIYERNVKSFISLFESIRYVDAEDDYDLFCTINSENEKRRALSSFFVHLMNNGTIKVEEIINIIKKLISRFELSMKDENQVNKNNEIGENLIILIKNGVEVLQDNVYWDTMEAFVKNISEMSAKNYPGISTKTIFKFMDLFDEL